MGSRQRTKDESEALFNRYLISTRSGTPDVYNVPLSSSTPYNVQNIEEQLVLYNKKVSSSDVRVLKEYILQSHRFLTKLHLNNNRTGPEGAKVLAELLERDKTMLQELFLNKNYLYDEGKQSW